MQPQSQRSRTLTGCGTCRSRHVKCDEARPVCQMCQDQQLECLGYERQLKWAKNSSQEADRVFRRPLFSELDQEKMTQMTAESLGRLSASTALSRLDRESEKAGQGSSQVEYHSSQGPFGLIQFASGRDLISDRASPESMDKDHNSLLTGTKSPLSGLCSAFDGVETPTVTLSCEVNTMENSLQVLPQGLSDTVFDELESQHSTLSIVPGSVYLLTYPGNDLIPEGAPDLLRYFKENIFSLSSPLKGRQKCPWQTIHLPTAMTAYAELSVYKTTSHTNRSLFYALLAASCLHMSTRGQSVNDWEQSSRFYKEIAKEHLALAMSEEIDGPKRAKYKSLLMAILSMVMLSIFSGQHTDAQSLLVDAEFLIRVRGLPKKHKSTKVRSLHHVYGFLRIMAESTCGCALVNYCPNRPSSSSMSVESLTSSLRCFRMADDSIEAEPDLALEKSNEMGQIDIHLEVLGRWKDTLYPDLYGIPESLMSLLSQTIRLANEQELLQREPFVGTQAMESLHRHTSLLESYILSWKLQSAPNPSETHYPTTTHHSKSTNCMAHAMHQALILFYYRRIPKISAWILQGTVRKCLEFLQRHDQACQEGGENDTVILWPGFVAACEALEADLQTQLLEWLLRASRNTSLSSFSAAAHTAQKVWAAREETKDYTLSWFDVMKHERCPIIAT